MNVNIIFVNMFPVCTEQGWTLFCVSVDYSSIMQAEMWSWHFLNDLLKGSKIFFFQDSNQPQTQTSLPTKICIVKAMAFPVVMYGYENWTINKAEC